ncbi:MAG TPA: ABC transporter ATP-binding protein [Nocardioidaceae bacterium]|nr:ABC transporter ATP-binding protein [Nocardioidaceae bacterium]
MSDSASIVVDHVVKRFKLSNQKTIKRLSVNAAKGRELSRAFTALDDITFTLNQGDTLGLMGLNGSGKSTLLKLISGVMRPDEGKVLARGRIAGLIEVGAGFHPDLSGRENIYLNGAILGMTKPQIDRKLESIVAFSEMEQFLGNSVRHYSSGMFMRLAFSVAVHTECDIFLIDEVLAVGDQPFKKKCMARIQDLKAEGRTMVFVSHSAKQVVALCERGIVLQKGRMTFDGTARDAVKALGYELDDDDDADEVAAGE